MVTAAFDAVYSGAMARPSTRSASWVAPKDPMPLDTLTIGRDPWHGIAPLARPALSHRRRADLAARTTCGGVATRGAGRTRGLSVDYVVRLEQGRATSPSAQFVASLARALQLQPLERDHA
ncbi:helix-turn-helix domain-containing protein [Streptomyces antimycoticus]|uniref:helix-turn-helix domain-containing protein n=1 Tax=Streptomyces antimycoticus TaxID=68175 RepID=UPI0035316E09